MLYNLKKNGGYKMEEQLRKELIMAAAKVLGEDAASKLDMAFTFILYK